uniref:Uncharacterized protein n=1 Tax=Heliothis virescens TaxID=7102 RepID=A0A2A4JEL0_HELVI
MLWLALLVISCSRGAAGDTNSSSEAPVLAAHARRAADSLVASLRRQLMQDNYDYQSAPAHKFHYEKSETKNLPEMPSTSHPPQRYSNAFAGDQGHHQQPGDRQQRYEQEQPHVWQPHSGGSRLEEPQQRVQAPPDYRDVRAVAAPDRRDDGYDVAFRNKRRDTNDPPYPPEQMHRQPARARDASSDPDLPDDQSESDSEQEPADLPEPASGAERDTSDSSASRRREQALYQEYGAQGVRPQTTRRPSGARQHVVSKQDLLYYMDDGKLRRHNRAPDAPRTERAPRSVLVTVAAGNVTYKLLTGRMCQRSVMRFEGPTYDRLGKEVRPAFIAGQRGRQFHHTTAPALVLPRCCNCCKKSNATLPRSTRAVSPLSPVDRGSVARPRVAIQQGGVAASSEAPVLAAHARRAADSLVASLRRQLMQDNYDYQSAPAHKFHYEKSETKNLPEMPSTSHPPQRYSNAFAGDQGHHQQPGDRQQRYEQEQPHVWQPHSGGSRLEEPQQRVQAPPDYRDVRAVAAPDRRDDGYDVAFRNKRRDTNDPPYPPEQMHRQPARARDASSDPDLPDDQSESDSEQEPADLPEPASGAERDTSDSSASRRREQALYQEYGAQGVRPQTTRRPSGARQHVVSKQDLLYYMDDGKLRRHNRAPDAPRTERAPRSVLVTVAAGNVTYKLLTMQSGAGRRAGERRFLEERAPGSVALLSLDRAPLPAFRLPRARRQYMHEPRRRL